MAEYTCLINDAQWEMLEPRLPKPEPNPKGGRPQTENLEVLEGILWILRTVSRWCEIPNRYPSPSMCLKRLRLWEEQDVWLGSFRRMIVRHEGFIEESRTFFNLACMMLASNSL